MLIKCPYVSKEHIQQDQDAACVAYIIWCSTSNWCNYIFNIVLLSSLVLKRILICSQSEFVMLFNRERKRDFFVRRDCKIF